MTESRTRRSRRRGNAPTLDDVAKQAGVLSMTVSRVINGAATVRESTRQRVRDAIRDVGYTPNEAARNLATANTIHIAMLYAKPSAFIAECLFGGLERVRHHNAQFIVEKCGDLSRAVPEIERIVDDGADGLLIAPPLADSMAVFDYFAAGDVPAVLVTSGHVGNEVSSVGVDSYKAAREMTSHLVSLGHRKIGFIVGHPEHATSELRLAGFRDAIEEAGLEHRDEYIARGYFTYRSGLEAAEQLLRLDEPPTAIFASNDDMAAATVAVAHRHGLDVPADLTICGYDDTQIATAIWPQLTTIHVPIAELSRAAADVLVDAIRAQRAGETHPPQHVVVDYTLVRRQSDAPPGRRA